MRFLRAFVLGGLILGAAALLPAPTQAQTQPPTATCTGNPIEDSAITECGYRLKAGTTQVRWDREDLPLEAAFAPSHVAAVDGSPDPLRSLQVWTQDASGAWRGWAPAFPVGFPTFDRLQRGRTYWFVASRDLAWSLAPPPVSFFTDAQILSYYGFPGVPVMGELGKHSAEDAADRLAALAGEHDALNGDRGVIPALHLIVAVADPYPNDDGRYLSHLDLGTVNEYARVTRERGMLLFLDIQVGWSDPLAEVRRWERVLREPHVHVALDPEFATKAKGQPPGAVIGSLASGPINQVQEYLEKLVQRRGLPPKILVLHQFLPSMLDDPENIAAHAGVDIVIDMDGWGPPGSKIDGYQAFAMSSYAEFAGFKLFYEWDKPLMTPVDVHGLPRPVDYLIYQ